jgi:DNA-directed RNA polymerase subunit RPC12/RpoP
MGAEMNDSVDRAMPRDLWLEELGVEWSWLCEDCGAGQSGFGEPEEGALHRCHRCGSASLSWEIDRG